MLSNDVLKIALVQQRCSEDTEQNLNHSIDAIQAAAKNGVRLVVLQELHRTPYFCQTEDTHQFDLAEPIPGPSTEKLAKIARENNIVIVGSLFEKRTAGLYHNTAVVLDSDGSLAGSYRKMHIPDDPGFYEKFYFTPGDKGFNPVNTSVGKLGVLVCWDQWFPEAARLMTLSGADFLIYPTAIGWDPADADDEKQRQLEAWMTIQRAHAVANGLPVLVCNRTGFEPTPDDAGNGINFWGNSFVCGPQGEILSRAGDNEEEVLYAEIDRQRSETVRRIWPYLRDRRIDAYDDLLLRFRDEDQ